MIEASQSGSQPAPSTRDTWSRVARRIRVPLGFIFAVVYVWLARPTKASLITGALVLLPGLVLRGFASGHVQKDKQLTTSGPYAYTRNPLYLGSLMLAAGFAIAARSWWIVAIMLADVRCDLCSGHRRRRALPATDISRLRRLCPPRAAHVAAAYALRERSRVLTLPRAIGSTANTRPALAAWSCWPSFWSSSWCGSLPWRHEPFTPGAKARLFSVSLGTTEVVPLAYVCSRSS